MALGTNITNKHIAGPRANGTANGTGNGTSNGTGYSTNGTSRTYASSDCNDVKITNVGECMTDITIYYEARDYVGNKTI